MLDLSEQSCSCEINLIRHNQQPKSPSNDRNLTTNDAVFNNFIETQPKLETKCHRCTSVSPGTETRLYGKWQLRDVSVPVWLGVNGNCMLLDISCVRNWLKINIREMNRIWGVRKGHTLRVTSLQKALGSTCNTYASWKRCIHYLTSIHYFFLNIHSFHFFLSKDVSSIFQTRMARNFIKNFETDSYEQQSYRSSVFKTKRKILEKIHIRVIFFFWFQNRASRIKLQLIEVNDIP